MNATIFLKVPTQAASSLRQSLSEAQLEHEVRSPAKGEGDYDRRMRSVPPEFVLVVVGAATSAAIQSLASIVREHIRSQRVRIRVQVGENEVEIEGALEAPQILALLDEARTDEIPAGEPE